MRRVAVIAVALALLGGCTVGPDYRAPSVAVPSAYGAASSAEGASRDLAQWWRSFDDPVLDDLVTRALAGNLDIRQAAARVRQARAQEQAVRRLGGPQLNANAQAGYTRLSENSLPAGLADLGNLDPGQSQGSGGGLGLPGEDFATFQFGFDASWELDLFGGRRRANEAARARTEATIWSRRDAEVTLAAEVANGYQQYRVLQRRIAIADEMLASQRERLGFVHVRATKGLTTTLDERRQQGDVAQLAAGRADLAAQADIRLHALGTLLGLAPTALAGELAAPAAPLVVVAVPAGLPSELLQRRPDIRAAERRFAAATADIGVATAGLYPSFSLTGALQLASRALSSLVESDSILANGAGRLSLPLIDGGRRATVRAREAQADEALVVYQADMLDALRDVEDALTRLDADRHRAGRLRAAATAMRDAADTTDVRYRNGLVAFPDVLDARRALLSASDALAQAEAASAQDLVALYKALGGGWDERRVPAGEDVPHDRGK